MSHDSLTSISAHRFAVIGGDQRMTHVARRLTEEGYDVYVLGCGEECLPRHPGKGDLKICTNLSKTTENADVIVLPLPASRDGETVHCPRDPACVVPLGELKHLLDASPGTILFGGKLPATVAGSPFSSNRTVDYYRSEILQLRNAAVTAEAALMTAMQLTDGTIRGAEVAVIGFGRIGKQLARLLVALGAEVTVAARREEVLFEIAAEGYRPQHIRDDAPMMGLSPLTRHIAIVFNTVPAHVLNRELLLSLETETLLIDLASAPFGVCDDDVREATRKNGLRYLRAPSLPGSYAPREAGRIIAECILDMLARREERSEEGGEGS